MIRISVGILLIGLVCSCSSNENGSRVDVLPYYEEATFTPLWLAGEDKPENLHRIADFSLINQDGEVVNNETFSGKVYVADFFFTSCSGICPAMTDNMRVLQDEFEKDENVMLISHSVTPQQDSVEVLNKYAARYGIQSEKWHLVTGTRVDIYDLGRSSYFVEEDLGIEKSPEDFLHTENFVLIDQESHIRGIYNGLNKGEMSQLIEDVRTLLKEG